MKQRLNKSTSCYLLIRLVEDLRIIFLSLAETGNLSLSFESVDMSELISADSVYMDQVSGNLVAYALGHTPSGDSVTLSLNSMPDSVQIIVDDTGNGIAPEDLPHVFDRFCRKDRSRSHEGDAGSGLGLAIVRQLVLITMGRLWLAAVSEKVRGLSSRCQEIRSEVFQDFSRMIFCVD